MPAIPSRKSTSPRRVPERGEWAAVGPRTVETRARHVHRILTELDSGRRVTQRSLSRDLGVALGLTNLLIRRLVKKGWVRVSNIQSNRVRYYLTPAGLAEKARMSRDSLQNTIHLYTETRERIRASLERLSSAWTEHDGLAAGSDEKRIAFYGAGEVAEIGYVSLQQTDLTLVGVIDDRRDGMFFGLQIHRIDALDESGLAGEPFGCLVVMSVRGAEAIRARLDTSGFPRGRVFYL